MGSHTSLCVPFLFLWPCESKTFLCKSIILYCSGHRVLLASKAQLSFLFICIVARLRGTSYKAGHKTRLLHPQDTLGSPSLLSSLSFSSFLPSSPPFFFPSTAGLTPSLYLPLLPLGDFLSVPTAQASPQQLTHATCFCDTLGFHAPCTEKSSSVSWLIAEVQI